MVSLKKQKGFTLVELLIVIIIIGILATLVIVTFTGVQAKARDSQRQTDIGAVNSHLEAFFAENGYYPTLKDLQTSTFLSTSMKGLDPESLVDPKGASVTGSAPVSGTYVYSYETTGCTATTASAAGTNECASYVLTAELEGTPSAPFVKQSNT